MRSLKMGGVVAAALLSVAAFMPGPRRGTLGQAKGYRTIHRLNRSQNWKRAASYAHARSISPFPNRPVR